ncbi:MAG TPA: HdeD family acid-resistance protein [Thermoanaerobaculia bacterium]|nr:HdeD family acid-resistance protein [Thermoanaerobaculia bacterium]
MATVEPRSGLHGLAPHWGLLLTLGIVELALGVIGLGVVGLVTLASVIFFAWLLLLSGVMHLVRAFRTHGWEGVALHLLIGILQGAVGVLILLRPAAGAASLTLLLAALFLVSGLFRLAFALAVRIDGWGWQVLSGLVTFVLGLLVAAGWPGSSVWVIGTFISIDLIFGGWSFIMIALAVRRVAPAAT